jgi:glycosyltransferase involved in cell wall biosynthesis
MRILQIGSDRSKRGVLYPGSVGYARQEAYAKEFGTLDIIAFSRSADGAKESRSEHLHVVPTDSASSLFYGLDALALAKRSPRPDVVSVQDPFETGLVGWLIAKRLNVPLHVQVHTDFLSPAYASHSLLNRMRVLIAAFVLKRATRIRVVSERIKTEIEKNYHLKAPVTVLPIYVDIGKFKHAPVDPALADRFQKFKTKLLVVSRLEPEKDIELAIRSFAKVAPSDSCLIIVGQGSEYARLKMITRELGVEGRIFFEGETEGARYYPLADLVLVTSRYEGYGLVIIEGLASGKPVLSTDVGVAREADAIVSSEKNFADDLKAWFENGPRNAELRNYPYKNLDDYVRSYCEDIAACVKR